MKQIPDFIITKEYKRFVEFCNACIKENYIGLCYGPAGVGKSMAAYHFARWHEITLEFERQDKELLNYTFPKIKIQDCNTVIYIPPVTNSPSVINLEIQRLFRRFEQFIEQTIFNDSEFLYDGNNEQIIKLFIIDEADRLHPKSLELVRDIYDRKHIAVVLIGMPGIEKRLIRFPQLYSRIGFAHAYKPLSKDEIIFIIQNHLQLLDSTIDSKNFLDQEAIAAFTRITQGNFRLIHRLLKQTIRIMAVNQFANITKEIVETARDCLVIGDVH
jgi:hypothetical protein